MTAIRDLAGFNAVHGAGLAKLLPLRPRIAVGRSGSSLARPAPCTALKPARSRIAVIAAGLPCRAPQAP